MTIENKIAHFFKRGLGKFVPNTEILKIQLIGLLALTFTHLDGFHQLREWIVTGNDLTSLPSNLLPIDADIDKNSLSNNKLQQVVLNFFDTKTLRRASFNNTNT